MEQRWQHSRYELLRQERYTPNAVVELLRIGIDVVRHTGFTGGRGQSWVIGTRSNIHAGRNRRRSR